jgi:hypothetical protein
MKHFLLWLFAALSLFAGDAIAQNSTAATPPANCSSKEYREFDFWLGEWKVMGGRNGDQLQGSNRIERSDDGCRIIEHWAGAGSIHGMSLNAWDAQYKVWRQFWVGGDGVVLQLEGGMEKGVMVMRGELPNGKGGVQKQKISWSPKKDGRVIQRWETSDDQGKTWAISFLGVYTKTK